MAQLASAQAGVLHRDQLLLLGATPSWIARGRRRRLRQVHPLVYALGHEHLDFGGRARAALLWAGPGAIISHRTAAILWDLLPADERAIDVTSPRRTAPPSGVVSHWARKMPRHQLRRGLPVTTAARTMLDIPSRRLLGPALYDKRTSVPQLRRELGASPGHPNARALRRLITTAGATRSHVEERFVALVVDAGLPRPDATNTRVAGYEVDAVWQAQRVVVELDTWYSHGDHLSFEDDHRRDADLMRAGYTVVRFTDQQLEDEPLMVIATLSAALYSAASSHQ